MSWYDKPIDGGPDDGGQDEEPEDPREPYNWDPDPQEQCRCSWCNGDLCLICNKCHGWSCEAREVNCQIGVD